MNLPIRKWDTVYFVAFYSFNNRLVHVHYQRMPTSLCRSIVPAERSVSIGKRDNIANKEYYLYNFYNLIEEKMRRELLTWDDVDALIDHLVPQFDFDFDGMVMITRGGIVPGGLLAASLQIESILTAAVDFPAEAEMNASHQTSQFLAWPQFIQFPEESLLSAKRLLIIDDVWGSGRTITAVKSQVSAAGGLPHTCVLHFNPNRNLFGNARPDYFAAITDAYIIYPWENPRGQEGAFLNL
jgi:hypoxanthine phosphoribosyltransferase